MHEIILQERFYMTIFIDADACPVTKIAENIAKKHGYPVTILCDHSHVITSTYATVKTISAGADAVDFALINLCTKGDIVITQDYGVASMALGKKAYAIHQSGMLYTNENIDSLLDKRHTAQKLRRTTGKHPFKKAKKRTPADDNDFILAFEKLLSSQKEKD